MNPFQQRQVVENLADLLYNFLPGSGNSRTAFPLAAHHVGLAAAWTGGSKRPAIVALLADTLQNQRHLFQPLIVEIVQQAMTWRQGKDNPLTRAELTRLNHLLSSLSLPITELQDSSFLDSLPSPSAPLADPPTAEELPERLAAELASDHLALSTIDPHPRGYAFERFLNKLFEAYGLTPREPFRLIGEQIDGSFILDNETYLLEAKWQGPAARLADLLTFSGKVARKASWTRGLFVSESGFSSDGLEAFRGQPTQIVCMDGLDLHETVTNRAPLAALIKAKVRRAAETGRPHVPFAELNIR